MGKRGPKAGQVTERAKQGASKGGSARAQHKSNAITPQEQGAEPASQVVIPRPKGISRWAQEVWANLMADELALAFNLADRPALTEWIKLRDELQKLDHKYSRLVTDGQDLVLGSAGQPQAHPYFSMRAKMRTEIRAMEKEFGMTPASRANILHTTAETALTVEQIGKITGQAPAQASDIEVVDLGEDW